MSFAALWFAQVLETFVQLIPLGVVVIIVVSIPVEIYRLWRRRKT
jgi:hypothetical protein